MNYGTKRMWLRRLKRIMLVLALIFTFIPRLWKLLTNDLVETAFITVFACVVLGFPYIIYSKIHKSNTAASAKMIIKARREDACVDHTLPRWAKEWNRPVTLADLEYTQEKCAEYWENEKAKQDQAAALQ